MLNDQLMVFGILHDMNIDACTFFCFLFLNGLGRRKRTNERVGVRRDIMVVCGEVRMHR